MSIFSRPLMVCSVLTTLCTLSFGQGTQLNREQSIIDALAKLRNSTLLRLSLTGTETVGSRMRSFSNTLYLDIHTDLRTGKQTLKVDIVEYDTTGGRQTLYRRFVGDGKLLYAFDFPTNRYSASYYHNPADTSEVRPEDDLATILARLYAMVPSPSAYMVRLVQEVYTSSNPVYVSWAPGESFNMVPEGSSIPDPIVGTRSYQSAETHHIFAYGLWDPSPKRVVAFTLDNIAQAGDNDWRLSMVTFSDRAAGRVTDWTILPIADNASPRWAFIPYTPQELQGWARVPAISY